MKKKKAFLIVSLALAAYLAYLVVRPLFYFGDTMNETFPDYAALRSDGFARCFSLKKMVPETARDICFEAHGGVLGLGWTAKFSCKVPEPEFRDFCNGCGYDVVENGFRNANPATRNATGENYGGMGDMPCPQHFLSYSYVKGNFGGLWLVFDCDTSVLTGCYSSN